VNADFAQGETYVWNAGPPVSNAEWKYVRFVQSKTTPVETL